MPNWYLGAVLCIAPFFIKVAPQMIAPSSWWFYLKLVSIVSACLYGFAVKRREVIAATLCVAVASFVSSNPYGQFEFIQMDAVFCGLLFFAFMLGQKIDAATVFKSLAFVCIVECAWIWLNYFGVDPFIYYLNIFGATTAKIIQSGNMYANGSLANVNHSAALVAMTLPFLKKKYWVIPILTVLIHGTMFPIVCICLVIAFIFAQKYGKTKFVWLGVLIAAILALIFSSLDAGFAERLKIWKLFYSWSEITLFGQGFGVIPAKFSILSKQVSSETFYNLHNELLETYAIFGIMGLVCLTYLLKPFTKVAKYPEIYACASVILVNSLGNFPFHIAPIFIIFITCYALLINPGEK